MRPQDSERAFRQFLMKSALMPENLNLEVGFQQVLAFYTTISAEHACEGPDADLLLYQWGTYDWTGTGATFQVNLTRQFMTSNAEDDAEHEDAISQLSLTFHYPSTTDFDQLDCGERWLEKDGDGLARWSSYVRHTPAFQKVANVEPKSVELWWEQV